MAENLAYKPSNGNYWAYNNELSNVAKYGYLYDWETAKKVAPIGWHLPTKEEWETLYLNLGNDSSAVFQRIKIDGNSGFNALLSGCHFSDGKFYGIESDAFFWSNTTHSENRAWFFYSNEYNSVVHLYCDSLNCGFSIRLFRD